jgi:GTP cyclohydrolase I
MGSFLLGKKGGRPGPEKITGKLLYRLVRDELSETTIRQILKGIGEDPDRDGLKNTPKRVLKSYQELYKGYSQKPEDVLSASFECGYDEMIILRDIPFYSTCEHHLLPFTGQAHIGYIPGKCGKVVGISKLARLLEVFARRAQIQEQMTMQVGQSLVKFLKPKGVAVVIQAGHLCMQARGVQKAGATMVTSYTWGVFRTKQATREEFLRLLKI